MDDQMIPNTQHFDAVRSAARFSVAPMIDWTDDACRNFHRLLSRRALLYTEMVTSPAIVHGDRKKLLAHDARQNPVALQIGGSDPAELVQATRIAGDFGYDEINLNVGCPSDRVQSGCFGAVLMKTPALVADCVADMIAASGVEVTVKCRIGVDDQDPAHVLPEFLDVIQAAGVRRVIIHARKAWLQGLSPRENREIPPLDYPLVLQMKQAFPDLHLSLNGGVADMAQVSKHLSVMDGVMVGRAAYHKPWEMLGAADAIWGDRPPFADPMEVALIMRGRIADHLQSGGRMHQITRHMLGLFHGRPGARGWRRVLSERGSAGDLADYDLALEQVTTDD